MPISALCLMEEVIVCAPRVYVHRSVRYLQLPKKYIAPIIFAR